MDGILDASVNLTGDFGPMSLAPDHHLGIGTREQSGTGGYEAWFGGKLYDVRIYNYALTSSDVAPLAGVRPTLTVQRWTGNQVRISWPATYAGYSVQQSSTVASGYGPSGLVVGVEGSENATYAPITTGAKFFRLTR